MNQLLRMLNFIVLSVLREKLPPKTLLFVIQSVTSWKMEDVDKYFTREDQLQKEYLKAYVRIANSRKLHPSHLENSESHKLPMSSQSELVKKCQTISSPRSIIRTSHPNSPRPFITISPVVPGDFPPIITHFKKSLPIPPILKEINESILLSEKKLSSCRIPDKFRKTEKVNKRGSKSKSNSSISVSSCSNKAQNYSALPYSTTAPLASYSASFPTLPPPDYTDDALASACYSETCGYYSQPSYTNVTTIASTSYSVPTPTPSQINYTSNGRDSAYYSETYGYYSQPSYNNATTITSAPIFIPSQIDYTTNGIASGYYSQPSYNSATTIASTSYSMPIPTPSQIDYTSNRISTAYYPETPGYYSQPSYTTATTITPAPIPTPSPIDYSTNGTASGYYSQPSYNSATTIFPAPTPTPSQIDYISNRIASTCYPNTSGHLYPSQTITAKITPASYQPRHLLQ